MKSTVIGTIYEDIDLDSSDTLGSRGVTYPTGVAQRGLTSTGGDSSSLSGRIIDMDLDIYSVTDQIRVVTTAIDAFVFYRVHRVEKEISASLRGQFDEHGYAVRTSNISHFGNPAQIDSCQITDENAHLTWYDVRQRRLDPEREVEIDNQYETTTLKLLQPRAMLLPAEKASDANSAFPEDLDHYKCYKVRDGSSLNRTVVITDQWESYPIELQEPAYFCVPVEKRVGSRVDDDVYPISNATDHLTIYKTDHPGIVVDLTAMDQLGVWLLKTIQYQYLAVPTLKKSVTTFSKN